MQKRQFEHLPSPRLLSALQIILELKELKISNEAISSLKCKILKLFLLNYFTS